VRVDVAGDVGGELGLERVVVRSVQTNWIGSINKEAKPIKKKKKCNTIIK
jgi:hypothetical protein